MIKKNEAVPYPAFEELRKEDDEEKPFLLFTISDAAGNVVRKLKTKVDSGINRFTWDLRYASTNPIKKASDENPSGYPVMPGKYKVTISVSINGILKEVAGPIEFEAKVLNNVTLPASDRNEMVAFQIKVSDLNRAINGAIEVSKDLKENIQILKTAIKQTKDAPQSLIDEANRIESENIAIYRKLVDDEVISSRNEPVYPSISARIGEVVGGLWSSTSAPTETYKQNYTIAADEFKPVLANLRQLVEIDVKNIQNELDRLNAPWTPGRVPDWKE